MKFKLSDIVEVTMGQSPKSQFYNTEGNGYPFLQGNRTFGFKRPTFDTYTTVLTKEAKAGDVIMSVRAPVGDLNITPVDMCLGRGVCSLRMKNGNQEFLYYMMKYYMPQLLNKESGTVFGSVNRNDINGLEVDIPSGIETQKRIARYLTMIDDKIELNSAINNNLEQQADALYQTFFSPKSGTKGKKVTLDEYCSIFTGKKNANASIAGGKYKFFTCAPDALQIDTYIFDGNAIIVSGNGAYTGRTRFFSGKFDLYQRTYACTLLDGLNSDYIFPLYWFVKLELSKKIMGGTRGSAIPYIVMNDLAKFEFIYNEETFTEYMPIFKSLTEAIQANEFENENLAQIRDSLLPKLMSGELDVSEIDI
jgi:restriction endonuclease S subunit